MAKKYFKHYEGADKSEFVQLVIKKHGLVGYAHWFLLLELMVSKYDGKSILIRLTVQEIASKLRIKSSRVHSVISQFSELNDNQVITKLESNDNQTNFDGFIIIIRAHILADLQAKDFGRERPDRANSDTRYKIKDNKIKDIIDTKAAAVFLIHEKLKSEFTDEYLKTVKIETQNLWFETYPDEVFLKTEILKACTWISNNKQKAPKKNFGQFFSSWLGRGWESYRKNLPTNSGTSQNRFLDGRSMANKIYEQVLKNGMHGLMQTLKDFNPTEVRALDIFGRASEILNCTDFQSTEIKNRLKTSCDQALRESLSEVS